MRDTLEPYAPMSTSDSPYVSSRQAGSLPAAVAQRGFSVTVVQSPRNTASDCVNGRSTRELPEGSQGTIALLRRVAARLTYLPRRTKEGVVEFIFHPSCTTASALAMRIGISRRTLDRQLGAIGIQSGTMLIHVAVLAAMWDPLCEHRRFMGTIARTFGFRRA
jgi:hypothetical protein